MLQSTDLAAADLETLVALNQTIAEWEQRRDAEAVRRLDESIAPDLIFRRADGTVVGKGAFMSALAAPSPFSGRATRDVSVSIVGERAVSTLLVTTTKRDGSSATYRNIRVLSRRHGRWCIDAWFNEEAPSGAAP